MKIYICLSQDNTEKNIRLLSKHTEQHREQGWAVSLIHIEKIYLLSLFCFLEKCGLKVYHEECLDSNII